MIWCFGQPEATIQMEGVDEYCQGIPDFNNYSGEPVLIIIDDLMIESSKSNDMLDMFTRKSHHQNISCILILQNFFHKNIRELTLNCKYIVMIKNPRSTDAISILGRQMNHGKRDPCLEMALKDAGPYGYVVIDLSQLCNDCMRVKSSLFPEECTVYLKC